MKHTVKVLLFIGTNFRGFDFKHYRQKSMETMYFVVSFYFRGLSGPRIQRTIELDH